MKILDVEDIPEELAAPWGTLHWSDQDIPLDLTLVRRARVLGVPIADYGGLVAVERDRVLAQVMVEHHSWTGPDGTERFTGVAGVVTRPDALHRGLCSRLLQEVHRRESSQGYRLAMLWTRRSWGAHRLYEQLGYRDVYSPPGAVLPPRSTPYPPLPSNFVVRTARRADSALLDLILARATRRRYGFVPRFPNSLAARFALGWRAPKDYHVLFRGSRAVGYFFASASRTHFGVHEGVATERDLLPVLIDAIQRQARGRWIGLDHTTLTNDAREVLEERGFVLAPSSHAVLMARSLSGPPSRGISAIRGLVGDPRFSCHRGDMF